MKAVSHRPASQRLLPEYGAARALPVSGFCSPRFRAFAITFVVFVAVGAWTWLNSDAFGPLDFYLAVFWTLPILTASVGFAGGLGTLRRMRHHQRTATVPVPATDELLVVVPTVGRTDTLPALQRVLRSTSHALPEFFSRFRIDVVIEEDCAARSSIEAIAAAVPHTKVVVVPAAFRTFHHTRFKARANHYANLVRADDGQACDDVWVLHMDDDTDLRRDTAAELARFVNSQQQAGDEGLDLCQGVLCYPRELAENRLVWLADAVRPGCDISLFAATTGSGSPRAGLHGEMLLVRASIEAAIGWDFGPRTIVEDAQFALHFCARYAGRSGWIPARSYGASPATPADFIRQRERWVWGLLELVAGRSLRYAAARNGTSVTIGPSRWQGLLMLHNTVVWSCAPLGHPAAVILLGVLLRDFATSPISLILVPVWAFNAAYATWLYWEGLRMNAGSSAEPRRRWWEPVLLLGLAPLFTVWEVVGILRGIWRFIRGGEPWFTVIAKPA